jgi:hypothetical protein
MNLYLDELPELDDGFRKMAGFATRLSETPENWPQELTSELYKQLPYLSDYDVNVNLDRVEPNRGFAFGYADVANKTERPEVEHEETGLPHIRIPIVVMERAAKPFSIFLDGEKVMPLTEERIRETLFNPATFDLSTSPPRDPSLVEATMPPQRSGMGMGGEYKMASADLARLSPEERFVYEAQMEKRALIGADDLVGGAIGYHYGKKQRKRGEEHTFGVPQVASAFVPGGLGYQFGRYLGHNDRDTVKGSDKEKKSEATPAELAAHDRAVIRLGNEDPVHRFTNHPATAPVIGALVGGAAGFNEFGNPRAALGMAGVGAASAYAGSKLGKYIGTAGARTETMRNLAKKHNPKYVKYLAEEMEKKSSLLLAIAPTLRERDVEAFVDKVANDQTLIAGFKRSGISPVLVEAFENTKRASAEDRLDALADSVEPTVVTFQKLPGGDFLVKSANVHAFIEKTAEGEVVPGQEVGQAIGQGQAQAMQPGQTATAVSEPVPEEAVEPQEKSNVKPVEEFGQYKTLDSMGNSVMGHVFPTTLSWDGSFSEQPIALFTNGSAYAMQDSILGELVGKGTNLPDDEPRGDGAFYKVEGGDAVATGPVTIGSSAAGPDGLPHLQATDSFGNALQIIQMEGLTEPQRISDIEMAIPKSWKFMRLNNQTQLQGGGGEEQSETTEAGGMKEVQASATLFFNGSYNIEGQCGLEKISESLRYDLDPVSAEFMLGVLGVDGATAKMKVAEARRYGHVKLANLKTITTMGERYTTSVKTASALLRQMPDLRRNLIKEAAALQDEGTVDNILALNFINPENLSTFISYIPNLEETSEKLAEMLLYSYLGMKEIGEGAVEHAMKGLEEVLVGLKSLAQTEG